MNDKVNMANTIASVYVILLLAENLLVVDQYCCTFFCLLVGYLRTLILMSVCVIVCWLPDLYVLFKCK